MSAPPADLKPWDSLQRREVFSDPPWVRVFKERVRLPSGRVIENFYDLRLNDYAAPIAQTDSGKILAVRVYKHGAKQVSLMLPGGGVEPGESPLAAAQRELLEETGYQAETWQPLGSFIHDANHYLCKGHFFLARGARPAAPARHTDDEVLQLVEMTPAEIMAAIQNGEVLMVGAACGFLLALAQKGVWA